MGLASDLIVAFGRLASSRLKGDANAILVNLRLLEADEADDEAEESTDEPMYGQLGFYARPRPPVTKAESTPTDPQGSAEAIGVRVADRVFVSLKDHPDLLGTNLMIYAPRKTAGGTVEAASAISIDSTAANAHICLMHEKGQSITLTKDEQIILANVAGDAYVAVGGSDGVVINSDKCAIAAATMLGDKNPALGEFVALATKLATELAAIKTAFDAHTHTAPSGGGLTTTPTTPMPTPGSVAATKVKAI
jgi:hypothetical protein